MDNARHPCLLSQSSRSEPLAALAGRKNRPPRAPSMTRAHSGGRKVPRPKFSATVCPAGGLSPGGAHRAHSSSPSPPVSRSLRPAPLPAAPLLVFGRVCPSQRAALRGICAVFCPRSVWSRAYCQSAPRKQLARAPLPCLLPVRAPHGRVLPAYRAEEPSWPRRGSPPGHGTPGRALGQRAGPGCPRSLEECLLVL
jgi:hypothetical protein